jgi:hypothetical protein
MYYDGSDITEFTYDNNGNRTKVTSHYKDDDSNDKDWNEKFEFSYNLSHSKADLIAFDDYKDTNMLTEIKYHDYDRSEKKWKVNVVYTCYWSEKTTTVSETVKRTADLRKYKAPLQKQIISSYRLELPKKR